MVSADSFDSPDGRTYSAPETPGQAAHVAGMPWTAPQSVPDLPGHWRERAAEAQRGANVRSVDYQRGTAFRRCASDLEDALAAQERPAPEPAGDNADVLDDFYFERGQVIALRAVLGEIFTCLAAGDPALLDDEQVAEWRERSGMEES